MPVIFGSVGAERPGKWYDCTVGEALIGSTHAMKLLGIL
jgi:hypothetical protein